MLSVSSDLIDIPIHSTLIAKGLSHHNSTIGAGERLKKVLYFPSRLADCYVKHMRNQETLYRGSTFLVFFSLPWLKNRLKINCNASGVSLFLELQTVGKS
jgi:hypothetical protein